MLAPRALLLMIIASPLTAGQFPKFDPDRAPAAVTGAALEAVKTRTYAGVAATFTGPEPTEARTQSGRMLPVGVYTMTPPPGPFRSTRQAATFFVGFIQAHFPEHRSVEFCADFIRLGKLISFTHFVQSSSNGKCVVPEEILKGDYAAGVHTHPGDSTNLDLPSQIPSSSDYAYAAYRKTPQYMGGPAGQVIEFRKSDIQCRLGKQFSMIKFESPEIHPARPDKQGEYAFPKSWRVMTPDELSFRDYYCK